MLTPTSLRRTRPDACLSDLQLDRLRVDEVDVHARNDLEAHLRQCERCRGRMDALVADAQAFAAVPARRRAPLVAALSTLAAAALVLVLVQRAGDDAAGLQDAIGSDRGVTQDPEHGTRTKGGARLGFFVRRDGRTFEGGPGQTLHPGDALRFHYAAPEDTWLAVLGVDAAGTISVYHPPGEFTARVSAGGDRGLDGSVILDGTLGEESIVGVFCAKTQAIATLVAALESDPRAPKLPAGCTHDRLAVEKIAELD